MFVLSKDCCAGCGTRKAFVDHYVSGAVTRDASFSQLDVPGFLDLTHMPPGLAPGPGIELPSTFTWNPARGETVLQSFARAPAGAILTTDDFRQGLFTALFHAEELAVKAGLAVALPVNALPPLSPGASSASGVMLGGGWAKAKAHPENPASATYLSVYASVQSALEASKGAPPNAPVTLSPPDGGAGGTVLPAYYQAPAALPPELTLAANLAEDAATFAPFVAGAWATGIAPVVLVVVGVLGLAAILAAAYVGVQKVQADADSLSRVQRCAAAAALARDGKPVPPGLCPSEPIRPSLTDKFPDLGGVAGGLAVGVAGLAALLFLRRKG